MATHGVTVDDGHKIRMKVLAKQMVAAVETLDALQGRAFDLKTANDPSREWVKEFQASSPFDLPPAGESKSQEMPSLENFILTDRSSRGQGNAVGRSSESSSVDDDLIDIALRAYVLRRWFDAPADKTLVKKTNICASSNSISTWMRWSISVVANRSAMIQRC